MWKIGNDFGQYYLKCPNDHFSFTSKGSEGFTKVLVPCKIWQKCVSL